MDSLKPLTSGEAVDPSGRQELRTWLNLVLQSGAAARAWRDRLAELVDQQELSDQEFIVLWLCADRPAAERGQSHLAEAMGTSPAQMSGLVDRLRRRNLLQFERLDHDRRRQVWQLTDAGQHLLHQLSSAVAASQPPLHGSLSRGEAQQLLRLLQLWFPSESTSTGSSSTSAVDSSEQGGRSSCAA
jgi:DNA-binding MarR family transcriptional regulator